LASEALTLRQVDAYYGDSHALQQVSFAAGAGRLLGLVGRNGAGKTTAMNVAVGLLPPRAGSVEVFGRNVAGFTPEAIAVCGVALVPQGRRVFRSLTVRENLSVAARKPIVAGKTTWGLDTVFQMFPRLAERRHQLASLLSGGEQQMLAIGRALMSKPRLLLIDEASLGLSPALAKVVFEVVAQINDDGTTVIIVEQNVGVLPYADRALIMEKGTLVFSGVGDEIRQANLRETYLGGDHE